MKTAAEQHLLQVQSIETERALWALMAIVREAQEALDALKEGTAPQDPAELSQAFRNYVGALDKSSTARKALELSENVTEAELEEAHRAATWVADRIDWSLS